MRLAALLLGLLLPCAVLLAWLILTSYLSGFRISPEPYNDVEQAIYDNDAQRLAQELEAGADPNAGTNIAPIQLAAHEADPVFVEILLQYGADVTSSDGHGWTALSSAAAGGSAETVEVLLDNGADPCLPVTLGGVSDYLGMRPLEVAKHRNNDDVLAVLETATELCPDRGGGLLALRM